MSAKTTCKIEFNGLPPFKAGAGPARTRTGAQQRQQLFKETAQQALKNWRAEQGVGDSVIFPWNPMSARISLTIVYSRAKGENDAANIVGGISDALQGVFYANDKQIVGIVYSEETLDESEDDRLVVEVSSPIQESDALSSEQLEMGIAEAQEIGEDWDKRIDEQWSIRAPASGDSFPGPRAAMDAARILGIPKLSLSKYRTLQSLLDSSERLSIKWIRKQNTIMRK